jgi:hypothetical protein
MPAPTLSSTGEAALADWVTNMQEAKWKLQGYDTFANEEYPIGGDFYTEADAVAAARAYLDDLERTQPSAASGGQDGVQDRVYVIGPTGARSRVEARPVDEDDP